VSDAPETVAGILRPDGSTATPLTLRDVVDAALEHNAQIQKVRLRREELRGQGWRARATGLPSFDLNGSWNRSRDPSFLLDLPPEFTESDSASGFGQFSEPLTRWRGSVSSVWELNPFRIVNAIQGVEVANDQYREDVEGSEYELAEEAIRGFHEIVLHQQRVEALDAEIAERTEFLDATRRRLQLELTTPLDTLRAAVALANVIPVRRRAAKDLFNAASLLNLVMGRDALTPLSIESQFDAERISIDVTEATTLAYDRPDIRSLELEIDFLRKQRGVFRADARPFVSAYGSYGYVARTAGDLFEGQNDFWDVNVALTIPLWDGFETKGRVIETNAAILQTEKELLSAQQLAQVEVAVTLEELAAAWENYDAARLNLEAAESARDQIALRYDLGRAHYLDFLNAQTARLAALSQTIEARYEVLVQSAVLKRVLGLDPMLPFSRVREALEGSTP
jgi:outer membrane protein TolC